MKGGELKIGPHKLIIPEGALTGLVTISGTSQSGELRAVDFAPHGLEFLRPVRLILYYDKCIVPAGAAVGVVYTGADGQILAGQPLYATPDSKIVEAWTDHFSGYAVAARW